MHATFPLTGGVVRVEWRETIDSPARTIRTTLTDFAQMFRSIFAGAGIAPFVSGDIFTHGFDRHDLAVVAAGAALLVGLGLRQEKGHALRAELSQKSISVQWAVCLGMLFAVIILGAYGPGYQALDPIYGGF